MKQRFSTRTRLVSALLTLAMVFTFLPFSAFAAVIKTVDELAFTTNGCDALQIKEGAQVNDWLESFKERMRNTDISQHPLMAVEGYGFSINMYVNTLIVVKGDGTIPGTFSTFSKENRYYLKLLIHPRDGYVFVPSQKFQSVKVDGKEVNDQPCYYPESDTSSGVWIRLPLSFQGTHKLTLYPEKPSTCTTTGTKSYSECEKCGKLFKNIEGTEEYAGKEELIIPALGHKEDEVNWDWDRTNHYSKCERCHIRMPGSTPIPHFYQSGGHTCPTCGYTWQEIEKAKIFVTEPAAGVSADSPAISNSPELYSATCQWFHNHQEFTGTFEQGETYTLQVTVKSIGMGYKFVKDTTYNVNGASVNRMPMYGVSNEGPWDSVTLASMSFVAKSEADSTEINSIYLTIPAPEAGKTAAEWEDKAQKTDSRYTVKRLYGWCEVDDAGNVLSDLSTGKFVEGKRYRVYVQLNAKTGYEFPDIANQIAVINGEEIAAVENPYGQSNTTRRNYIVYLTAVPGVVTPVDPAPVGEKWLTVGEGKASVNEVEVQSTAPGSLVTLKANPAPDGMVFDQWQFGDYEAVKDSLSGLHQETVTFIMPNQDLTVQATYKMVSTPGGGSTGGGSTIPPEAGKYQLTVTDGVATVNGSTGAVLNVTPGDTVTLTADTTKFPENEEFGWWEISPYGSVSNTLTGQYQRTATFKMPPENVSARAMSKTAGVSTGGDDGGGAAILLVGGAAVAGLVGYGVYSYVSEQQLKALLPEGVAMPENRAQTALLLWNTAGRPEPAAQPAFPDVADQDTAKAAQWCVEQGLMNAKFRGRFAPDGSSPAYKTLNAYRQLAG